MFSTHSFLLLGLVLMIAIMPLTLVEAGILSLPILVLLGIASQVTLATGFVALEMILAVLLPLAIMSSLVQFYRTIVAAQEVAFDPLTGCFTRAFGLEMMRVTFDNAVRKNVPYTVAFIDLDDFKQINDRNGHDYGDRILAEVGKSLISRFRLSDMVVRWGGEEFLVLLPEVDTAHAEGILDRVMTPGLASLGAGKVQRGSVGVAERLEDAIAMPQNLIDLADQRMYDAKRRRDHDDMIAGELSGRKTSVAADGRAMAAGKSAQPGGGPANQPLN
ncbi:GGDEF domain-containing protein [Thalassospira lucentensis]|uniref:GGDEF domain-containing protein n=1 Tax=Thalassospira lucentensis TaxID=168935 RepID=UPI0020CA38F2|nr:GGDEF domain-containing protein [Thalassospira lucentensis]